MGAAEKVAAMAAGMVAATAAGKVAAMAAGMVAAVRAVVRAAEVKVAEEKVARSYSTDARRTNPRCRSDCRVRPVPAALLGTLERPLPRRKHST